MRYSLWCICIEKQDALKLINPTSIRGSKGSDQGSDSEGTMASPGVTELTILLGVTLCERLEIPYDALFQME